MAAEVRLGLHVSISLSPFAFYTASGIFFFVCCCYCVLGNCIYFRVGQPYMQAGTLKSWRSKNRKLCILRLHFLRGQQLQYICFLHCCKFTGNVDLKRWCHPCWTRPLSLSALLTAWPTNRDIEYILNATFLETSLHAGTCSKEVFIWVICSHKESLI